MKTITWTVTMNLSERAVEDAEMDGDDGVSTLQEAAGRFVIAADEWAEENFVEIHMRRHS